MLERDSVIVMYAFRFSLFLGNLIWYCAIGPRAHMLTKPKELLPNSDNIIMFGSSCCVKAEQVVNFNGFASYFMLLDHCWAATINASRR